MAMLDNQRVYIHTYLYYINIHTFIYIYITQNKITKFQTKKQQIKPNEWFSLTPTEGC